MLRLPSDSAAGSGAYQQMNVSSGVRASLVTSAHCGNVVSYDQTPSRGSAILGSEIELRSEVLETE